jgi:hypothetical protein
LAVAIFLLKLSVLGGMGKQRENENIKNNEGAAPAYLAPQDC